MSLSCFIGYSSLYSTKFSFCPDHPNCSCLKTATTSRTYDRYGCCMSPQKNGHIVGEHLLTKKEVEILRYPYELKDYKFPSTKDLVFVAAVLAQAYLWTQYGPTVFGVGLIMLTLLWLARTDDKKQYEYAESRRKLEANHPLLQNVSSRCSLLWQVYFADENRAALAEIQKAQAKSITKKQLMSPFPVRRFDDQIKYLNEYLDTSGPQKCPSLTIDTLVCGLSEVPQQSKDQLVDLIDAYLLKTQELADVYRQTTDQSTKQKCWSVLVELARECIAQIKTVQAEIASNLVTQARNAEVEAKRANELADDQRKAEEMASRDVEDMKNKSLALRADAIIGSLHPSL